MPRHVTRLIIRTILLAGLWMAGSAGPLHAGYCEEVCYPTCDSYEGYCAAAGGWTEELCGCIYGTNQYCNLPTCYYSSGGGGDEWGDDDDYI